MEMSAPLVLSGNRVGVRAYLHFGDFWYMSPYTFFCLDEASKFLFEISKGKKTVLFVGTKPQFGSVIEDCALKCNATLYWL